MECIQKLNDERTDVMKSRKIGEQATNAENYYWLHAVWLEYCVEHVHEGWTRMYAGDLCTMAFTTRICAIAE